MRIEDAKFLERVAEIAGIGQRGGDLVLVARSLGLGTLPGSIGFRHAPHLAAETAEGIDEIAVAARIDQRAVVMLAVDLDQRLARGTQELHADARVVDEGAASAVRPLHAPQDQRGLRLEAVFGQQRQDRVVAGKSEDGRHLALARAAPHQRGIAPAAKRERKGIEQDRFAGAGLAGQRRQARTEFEIEFVDQDDVADRQGL